MFAIVCAFLLLLGGCSSPSQLSEPVSAHADVYKKGLGAWHFSGSKTLEVTGPGGWYYNWAPAPSGDQGAARYVPMIWGRRDLNNGDLDQARRAASPELLGFNEPDGCGGDEAACMTSEEAAWEWPRLVATGKRLGSPAVARDTAWLDRFMAARGSTVSFVAVHTYQNLGNPQQAADHLIALLDWYHKRYGKPLWLTEFGSLGDEPQWQIDAFIKAAIPKLEALPYLERYAWFSDHSYRGSWRGATFYDDGRISDTGRTYRDTH